MKKKGEGKTQPENQIHFLMDEAIPKGETERKRYMSDCAFFYGSVFKKKLEHFIGLQLEELSQVGRTEKMYDFIRANINCFRLIDEWFDKNTKEHFGNLEEIRNNFSEEKDFLEKMKETYEL